MQYSQTRNFNILNKACRELTRLSRSKHTLVYILTIVPIECSDYSKSISVSNQFLSIVNQLARGLNTSVVRLPSFHIPIVIVIIKCALSILSYTYQLT